MAVFGRHFPWLRSQMHFIPGFIFKHEDWLVSAKQLPGVNLQTTHPPTQHKFPHHEIHHIAPRRNLLQNIVHHLPIKSTVNVQRSFESNRRMTEPRQITVEHRRHRGYSPTIAVHVVHEELVRVTLSRVHLYRAVIRVPAEHQHKSVDKVGRMQVSSTRSCHQQFPSGGRLKKHNTGHPIAAYTPIYLHAYQVR